MSKQNAVDLARTARSEAESITKGDKRTIAAIINNWNECVKQAGFWCIYDFPTTGYTRKSQLVADLLRCADQLDEYVEPNPHAALTRVLDVEEAHAEALEMNAQHDENSAFAAMWIAQDSRLIDCLINPTLIEADHVEALQWNAFIDHCWPLDVEDVLVGIEISAHEDNRRFDWLANRWSLFWAGCDYFTRRTMIEEAHSEALRIDAEQYAAPVTCSIFQRNDGVQLALDSSCDVRFIRTSKNGEWFKAGFRNTDMEGYQPVESDVLFTSMPSRTLSYSDGVMVVSEA
ncbi:hypothetical protein [Enterobacter roggenkampii]|uniref:hypothetical protein n=1 Tax=Enterobacter roggenkampii TaxID=1812935 RepID=UPI0021CEA108|nr:hypothetical protein [Enterobacter roggenkampii]MCU6164911.1 hypothetical protein [Enterobacter roggenkampii]